MVADRQTVQRIIIEHTEIFLITTTMEYLVPNPLYQFQQPVGRGRRSWNGQPDWLPLESHDVNSSNNPDILAQNALHPSGIYGTRLKLSTGLLNTMNRPGPNLSNLGVPHPPVHANFLNKDQSVPELPAQNGENTQHSFATHQSPSYATFSSNVSLQEDTAYSNLPEPQDTLPTRDFDPYETNNMGDFTTKEESLDSGYSPYTALPYQQSFNIASNSNLCPTVTADSYTHDPLGPSPNIEPQGFASSGTSASLNMLAEQHPVSNMLDFYGSEYTTASTGSEIFIPPYVATNASVPSGRKHFRIHTPRESLNERRLPSEAVRCKSQTRSSNFPSHSCAASLYLSKTEDCENMGPLRMDTAMQLTPEISDYNDLDDPSPRHHLIPGVCNYNIANLSDNLAICHTINDHVKHEDLDSSGTFIEPLCIANNINPSTRNIWGVSTHTDVSVNADSDTSVEEDADHSIKAELEAMFTQFTTAGDYHPKDSSARETGDVNAANPYNVNNGNNPIALEPSDSQYSTEPVIRDAGSEETQPRRRKGRPRKKANLSEETQPRRRKYRPRKKTNILPAAVDHCQETEVHDVCKHHSSMERRTNPKHRYFCLDETCRYSGERGFAGFVTKLEASRHINNTTKHRTKHYRCTLLHTEGEHTQFGRSDNLKQ